MVKMESHSRTGSPGEPVGGLLLKYSQSQLPERRISRMSQVLMTIRPRKVTGGKRSSAAARTGDAVLMRDLLIDHFGPCCLEDLVITRGEFPRWMRADIQHELDAIFGEIPTHGFCGARLRGNGLDFRFPNLLEDGEEAIAVGPAVYQDIDIGEAEPARCLLRGLWLAETEGTHFGVLLDVTADYHDTQVRVDIAVPPGEIAQGLAVRLLRRIRAAGEGARAYRGKILTLEPEEYTIQGAPADIVVEDIAPAAREDVILPERMLQLIERNTIGFAGRMDALTDLGMSGRKGVLLYGPPGTGKTLVVRYLAGELKGFTTFLVAAQQYGLLHDYIEMARLLQPALVVLEDVDLVGADRDGPWQGSPAALNDLLNQMDGLTREAKILFVMTTNRPEVLEPALAGRPGRVDQAIEFSLPEDPERRRLIRRYMGTLAMSEDLVASVSKRVGKVAPAFIKELMRRAAECMLERSNTAQLSIDLADVERALEDMLVLGGKLNTKLLGAEEAIGFTARR